MERQALCCWHRLQPRRAARGPPRRYVFIIQFTAFLLTLRRKNLCPHGPLVATYGLLLIWGFLVSTFDHYQHGSWLAVNLLANGSALLRMKARVPKYLLWAGLYGAVHACRAAPCPPSTPRYTP